MVKIRLARGGAKKRPFYSIVVTDKRRRRDSGYIERIGYFNPVAKGAEQRLILDTDKLSMWTDKGAKLSDRVKQLLKEYNDPSIREKSLAKKQVAIEVREEKKILEIKAIAEAQAKEAQAKEAEEKEAKEAEEKEAKEAKEAEEKEAQAKEAASAEIKAEAEVEKVKEDTKVAAETPVEETPVEEAVATKESNKE